MIQVVELAGVKPQPWLNGGGVTRDLWAGPAGPDWLWRVSVATIDRDGPFSSYPGVDRHFAVLQGAGVRLRFAAQEQVLTAASDACHFDGADAPQCSLLDGTTLDLNLLVQRQAGTGWLQRAEPGAPWRSSAAHRAVWCGAATLLQVEGQTVCSVPAGALAYTDRAGGERWTLDPIVPANAAGPVAPAWWMAVEGKVR